MQKIDLSAVHCFHNVWLCTDYVSHIYISAPMQIARSKLSPAVGEKKIEFPIDLETNLSLTMD